MTRKIIFLLALVLTTGLVLHGCMPISDKANLESQDSGGGSRSIVSDDGLLTFSHIGGLYEGSFGLELSGSGKGVIRYTLDGSDPSSLSEIYEEPIKIDDRTSEENKLSAIIIENNSHRFPGNKEGVGDNEPPELPQEITGPEENRGDTNWKETENQNNPDEPIGREGFAGGEAAAPEENVFKGTVVKAAVFSEDGEQISETLVQSYFVDEEIQSRYGLPIVSIVTDQENFFNEETGLYTNSSESGSEWERPVHFELYASDGTPAVSQYMGVRLSGNSTRNYQQKSMRFYAKSEYDEMNKTVEYEIFEGLTKSYNEEPLTSFKKVLLRNSGNDNSSTLMRDSLMQDLVSDLNLDIQASQPCAAFVNGEFWGIYNIRERYDNQYFSNHYDIDKSDVAVLEISNSSVEPEVSEGDETDLAYYQEMWNFFEENSMNDEANYKKAQEYIDIDNVIDYFIANIYSGNTDWPANNNIFWRYKTENGGYDSSAVWYMDGRYRWVLKDMDFGFGLMGQASDNTLEHATSEEEGRGGFPGRRDGEEGGFENNRDKEREMDPTGRIDLREGGGNENTTSPGGLPGRNGEQGRMKGFTSASSTLIFRKLLENEEFKDKFINRFSDVMNTNYNTDYVMQTIDEFKGERETAMQEHINRYSGAISSLEEWEQNIEDMKSYIKERTPYVQGFLKETFNLGDPAALTLLTDGDSGYIQINEKEIKAGTKGVADPRTWSGEYFTGTTQTIRAVSLEGNTFSHFIVTDMESGESLEYTEETIQIKVGSKGASIQAVFQ